MKGKGQGYIFQKRGYWWIGYSVRKNGKPAHIKEPAYIKVKGELCRAKSEQEARRALKSRRDQVGAARMGLKPFAGPQPEKLTVGDLLDGIERDAKKLKSRITIKSRLGRLRRRLGDYYALAVTPDVVATYKADREIEGAAPATINRELEILRRAFRLAREEERITYQPLIKLNALENARQGFIDGQGFGELLKAIEDDDLRDFAEWAYWTGMRKGEIASLTWSSYDRRANEITLDAAATKSVTGKGKARTIPLDGPLDAIIKRRRFKKFDSPYIFHRNGGPVMEFRRSWRTATKKVGRAGLLFHDLRRSAVRNLIRAGVEQNVAMKISGHKTVSTFDRYNIIDTADVRDALRRTAKYVKVNAE